MNISRLNYLGKYIYLKVNIYKTLREMAFLIWKRIEKSLYLTIKFIFILSIEIIYFSYFA